MFKFFKRRKKEKLEKEIQLVKEQEAIEVKKDHETEFREKMDRMKSLNKMKRDSFKYQTTINEYSVKAKRAFEDGNKREYLIHRNSLKLALKRKEMMDIMIAQTEASQHNKDMDESIQEFLKTTEKFTEQMKKDNPDYDVIELHKQYEEALNNNTDKNDTLNIFLDTAVSSYQDFSGFTSEDELDSLIFDNKSSNKIRSNSEIDEKLEAIRKELKE